MIPRAAGRRGAAVLGGALSLAVAGCAADAAREGAVPSANARYVAMGSSFAAGSGFGPIKPDTPQRCGRSTENYASLLARQLELALVDVTCGGATTAHILGPWDELPAQIEAVTPDTALVTITIGGNDIGYVEYLLAQSIKQQGPIRIPGGELPAFEANVPDEAAYRRLENALRTIAAEVKSRAPHAILVFVQYFAMVPDSLCDAVPLDAEAARTGRAIGQRLAETTARVAHETGSMLIPVNETPQEHTPCGADPWVVGHPADFKPGDTFPWHPTRAGHAAIADALVARLSGQQSDQSGTSN